MTYRLDIKISAQTGVLNGFDYYENKQEGLGQRFLDSWEASVESLKNNPLLFQKKHENFRQLLIKPYPYHIIYEVESDLITVYKVIYAGRHPRKRYTKK